MTRAHCLALLFACSACSAAAPVATSEGLLATLPPGAVVVVVQTVDALVATLNDPTFHGTIYIPNGTHLVLSGHYALPLHEGVTLLGGRSGIEAGATLDTTDLVGPVDDSGNHTGYSMFEVAGDHVTIRGLRLIGPSQSWDASLLKVNGIRVRSERYRDFLLQDCELAGWTAAAVQVTGAITAHTVDEVPPDAPHMTQSEAYQIQIRDNYIHDNVRDGAGYGVNVDSGSYVQIEGNVFDGNRHAIASDGAPYTGYIARWNYVLQSGHCAGDWPCYYNQHFDVHGRGDGGYGGVAGEYFDIAHNTFRGDQSYRVFMTRPAFMLRGTPMTGAYFHDNVLVHHDEDAAVRLDTGGIIAVAVPDLYISRNQYDTDHSTDLAVGDFDGDGRDDVLLTTGAAWYYSSGGVSEWRFLRASTLRVAELGFGNFDDDPRTDVFFVSGTQWYYVSGGSGPQMALRTSGEPPSEYRFGDFDGDGKTDVFALEGGQWSWSKSGQTGWAKLNDTLSSDLSSLVFGDFDGDHKTDIAQRSGDVWRFSQGGRTAWRQLWDGSQSDYRELRAALVGDFDGNGASDALRYQAGGARFMMWSRSLGAFHTRSLHDML